MRATGLALKGASIVATPESFSESVIIRVKEIADGDQEIAHEVGGGPAALQDVRLHATKKDIPKVDVVIDATAPLESVVDEILEKCKLDHRRAPVLAR
jgi:hypothetical protein